MRTIKYSAQQNQFGRHFLMRPSSTSNLSLFQCLLPCSARDIQLTYRPKVQMNKRSMKNLLQRSTSQIFQNVEIDESKAIEQDRKTLVHNTPTPLRDRKPSELTQISSSSINIHSQKTTPKKYTANNQLAAKKLAREEVDIQNEDHNTTRKYDTLHRYLSQGDKTTHRKPQNHQPHTYDFTGLEDTIPENTDTSPKWNQVQSFAPPETVTHKDQPNTYRFSFGHQQNKMFMNKFGGFREVSSNRPSKESFSSQGVGSLGLKEQFGKSNLTSGKKLQAMVRDVHIMDEQFDDFSESNSQVIESYQNIMSRIQSGKN